MSLQDAFDRLEQKNPPIERSPLSAAFERVERANEPGTVKNLAHAFSRGTVETFGSNLGGGLQAQGLSLQVPRRELTSKEYESGLAPGQAMSTMSNRPIDVDPNNPATYSHSPLQYQRVDPESLPVARRAAHTVMKPAGEVMQGMGMSLEESAEETLAANPQWKLPERLENRGALEVFKDRGTSIGDKATKLAYSIAQQSPQILSSIGMAAAGAATGNPILGMAGLGVSGTQNYLLEAGGVYNDLRQENPKADQADLANTALVHGVVASALEFMPEASFLTKIPRLKNTFLTATKKELLKQGNKSMTRKVVEDLVSQGFTEGSTEWLQEVSANAAKRVYNENQNLFEGADESGFIGTIMGILTGGLAGISGHTPSEKIDPVANTLGKLKEANFSVGELKEFEKNPEALAKYEILPTDVLSLIKTRTRDIAEAKSFLDMASSAPDAVRQGIVTSLQGQSARFITGRERAAEADAVQRQKDIKAQEAAVAKAAKPAVAKPAPVTPTAATPVTPAPVTPEAKIAAKTLPKQNEGKANDTAKLDNVINLIKQSKDTTALNNWIDSTTDFFTNERPDLAGQQGRVLDAIKDQWVKLDPNTEMPKPKPVKAKPVETKLEVKPVVKTGTKHPAKEALRKLKSIHDIDDAHLTAPQHAILGHLEQGHTLTPFTNKDRPTVDINGVPTKLNSASLIALERRKLITKDRDGNWHIPLPVAPKAEAPVVAPAEAPAVVPAVAPAVAPAEDLETFVKKVNAAEVVPEIEPVKPAKVKKTPEERARIAAELLANRKAKQTAPVLPEEGSLEDQLESSARSEKILSLATEDMSPEAQADAAARVESQLTPQQKKVRKLLAKEARISDDIEGFLAEGESDSPRRGKGKKTPDLFDILSEPEFRDDYDGPLTAQQREIKKLVKEMPKVELDALRTTHETTGIPNRRAYDLAEAEDRKAGKTTHKALINADHLKFVRENTEGTASEEQLLTAVAEAIQEVTDDGYHVSDGKFVIRGKSEAEVQNLVAQVKEKLATTPLHFKNKSGKGFGIKRPSISHKLLKRTAKAVPKIAPRRIRQQKTGMSTEVVENSLKKLLLAKSLPKWLKIIATEDQLPAEALRKLGLGGPEVFEIKNSGTIGLYYEGNIYFIAENLDSVKYIPGILVHEGGHFLRRNDPWFQSKYAEILERFSAIAKKNDAAGEHAKSSIALALKHNERLAERPDLLDEEGLMYFVQDFRGKPEGFSEKLVAIYEDLKSLIKRWIFKTFPMVSAKKLGLTGKDIGDIILSEIRARVKEASMPSQGIQDVLASSMEDIETEFTLDKTNLLPTLLKDIANQDPAKTMIYELLQNSLDALNDKDTGNVNITFDDGELVFEDNGIGMLPEEVQKFFLVGGSIGKTGTSTRGGYGLAKIALLLIPDSIYLQTLKNGILSTVEATREQIYSGKITIKREISKEGTRASGTSFIAKLPKKLQDKPINPYSIRQAVQAVINNTWSNTKIEYADSETILTREAKSLKDEPTKVPSQSFSLNGSDVTVHFIKTEPYGFDWGSTSFAVDSSVTNKGLKVDVASRYVMNGHSVDMPTKPDFKIIVDFEKTPDVRSPDYPFLKNRTEITKAFGVEIEKIVKDKVRELRTKEIEVKGKEFKNMYEKSPEFLGIKVLIPYTGENHTYALDVINRNKDVIVAFSRAMKQFSTALEASEEEDGVDFHLTIDPKVHGFKVRKDVVGLDIYAINPFSISTAILRNTTFDQKATKRAADCMVHTLVHEYAHKAQFNHSSEFASEILRLTVLLGHETLYKLSQRMERFYADFSDRIIKITEDLSRLQESGDGLESSVTGLPVREPSTRREENVSKVEKTSTVQIPQLRTTEEAVKFGKTATPEQVAELEQLRKESLIRSAELLLAKDWDNIPEESFKGQLYREAIESSRGEHPSQREEVPLASMTDWSSRLKDEFIVKRGPKKADAKEWIKAIDSWIKKSMPAPVQEEMFYSNLPEWLADQTGIVTRDDILNYLDMFGLVNRVFETSYGNIELKDTTHEQLIAQVTSDYGPETLHLLHEARADYPGMSPLELSEMLELETTTKISALENTLRKEKQGTASFMPKAQIDEFMGYLGHPEFEDVIAGKLGTPELQNAVQNVFDTPESKKKLATAARAANSIGQLSLDVYNAIMEINPPGVYDAKARWQGMSVRGEDSENYSEILIRLPQRQGERVFEHGHYSKAKNIVTTLRGHDEGNSYYIDEMQSDLHQRGHKYGYSKIPVDQKRIDEGNEAYDTTYGYIHEAVDNNILDPTNINDTGSILALERYINSLLEVQNVETRESETPERIAELKTTAYEVMSKYNLGRLRDSFRRLEALAPVIIEDPKVADLPFKNNWKILTLKRAVIEAVNRGKKSISWAADPEQVAWIEQWDDLTQSSDGEWYIHDGKRKVTGVVNHYLEWMPKAVQSAFKQYGGGKLTSDSFLDPTDLNDDGSFTNEPVHRFTFSPELIKTVEGNNIPLASQAAPVWSSRLEDEFIIKRGPKKADAKEWLKTIKSWMGKSMPMPVQEEMFYSNLPEWLEDQEGTVTRAQVMEYLDTHGLKNQVFEKVRENLPNTKGFGQYTDLATYTNAEALEYMEMIPEAEHNDMDFHPPYIISALQRFPDQNLQEIHTSLDVLVSDRLQEMRDVLKESTLPPAEIDLFFNDVFHGATVGDTIETAAAHFNHQDMYEVLQKDGSVAKIEKIWDDSVRAMGELISVENAILNTADVDPSKPRWQGLTLRGQESENYTEILVQVPQQVEDDKVFNHGHYRGIKNIVTTLRGHDEGDSFFIDEMQSDLHQKGHILGYTKKPMDPEAIKQAKAIALETQEKINTVSQVTGLSSTDRQWLIQYANALQVGSVYTSPERLAKIKLYIGDIIDEYKLSGLDKAFKKLEGVHSVFLENAKLADLPFKNNWKILSLKRAVIEAINRGKTSITWASTPEQTAYIEQWGKLKEQDGEYTTGGGNKVTGAVKQYTEWMPKAVQKVFKQYGGGKLTKTQLFNLHPNIASENLFNQFIFSPELIATVKGDEIPLAAKKAAPVWSSRLEDEFIIKRGPKKADAKEWLKTIKSWMGKSMPMPVQEEMFYSNLPEWLEDQEGAVTRAQVMEYLDTHGLKNQVFETEARDFNDKSDEEIVAWIDEQAKVLPDDDHGDLIRKADKLIKDNPGKSFHDLTASYDKATTEARQQINKVFESKKVSPSIRDAFYSEVLYEMTPESEFNDKLDEASNDVNDAIHNMLNSEKEWAEFGELIYKFVENYDTRSILNTASDFAISNKIFHNLGSSNNEERSLPQWRDLTLRSDESENYTEILIQIPVQADSRFFEHGHYREHKNIVVTLRGHDEGDYFYIDEIQSDLHQTGRKRGYSNIPHNKAEGILIYQTFEKVKKRIAEAKKFSSAELTTMETLELNEYPRTLVEAEVSKERLASLGKAVHAIAEKYSFNEVAEALKELEALRPVVLENAKVADLPFKNNWKILSLKRAVIEAVNRGKKGIIWASDPQQVAFIEQWGAIEELDGEYTTAGDHVVTGVVKQYVDWMPKAVQKIFKPFGGGKLTKTRLSDLHPHIADINLFNQFVFSPELIATVKGDNIPLAAKKATPKATPKVAPKSEAEKILEFVYGQPTKAEIKQEIKNSKIHAATTIAINTKDPFLKQLATLTKNILAGEGPPGFERQENQQTTSPLERLLSSPEYYLRKDPAGDRIVDIALNQNDLRYGWEQDLTGDSISFLEKLWHSNPRAYERGSRYLIDCDKTGKGFSVKLDKESGKWVVLGLDNKIITPTQSEQEAIDTMIDLEQKMLQSRKWFDKDTLQMVKEFRLATNRGFDLLAADLDRQVRDAKEHGMKEPTIKHKNDAGETEEISLTEVRSIMGDLRGTYFPRERQSKGVILVAEKPNGERQLHTFDMFWPKNVKRLNSVNKIHGAFNELSPIGRMARKLQKEGFTNIKADLVKTPAETLFDTPGLISAVDNIMKATNESMSSKKAKETEQLFLDTIHRHISQRIADIYKTKGNFSSKKQRSEKLWEGYETDPAKALASYIQRLSAGAARRETARKLMLAFTGRDISFTQYKKTHPNANYKDYRSFVKARAIDPTTQKNLHEDVRTYIRFVLKPDTRMARAVGYMKAMAVLWFLGARGSSAVINLTNMAIGAPGTIAAHSGLSITKSFALLGQAASLYGKYRITHMMKTGTLMDIPRSVIEKLTPANTTLAKEDNKIFDYIVRKGWDEAQFNHDATRELQDALTDTWNAVVTGSMYMFGATEKANRAMTIFAAAKALQAKYPSLYKNDFEAFMLKARHTSDRAHGVYGKGAKPWLIQKLNLVDLPYTFQKFQHNALLNAMEIGFRKGVTDNQKMMQAKKNMLFLLLQPALISGLKASLPLALIAALWPGDDPEEELYEWSEEVLGSDAFTRHGVAGLMGVNLRGSLQVTNPLPTKLSEIAGAPGAILTNFIEAADHFGRGETWKGIEKVAPTAIGSTFKGIREWHEGVTTANYSPVFFGENTLKGSGSNMALRAFSFNPSRLSGIREKQWREEEVRRDYLKERTDVLARLRHWLLKGTSQTQEEYTDIMADAMEYNDLVTTANPKYMLPYITPDWIKQNITPTFRPSKLERYRQ